MSFAFDLWKWDDVKTHGPDILDRLRAGTMPRDGAWPEAAMALFERWINEGMSE
jgi:hypothetical protein